MDMIRVSSSAIRAVGYDPESQLMKITFAQGDTYNFCRVPEHVYEGLMKSGSKGMYYNDWIRDQYQC